MSCMKVGTGGNLGLSREYHKKLFGPLFYPWWNFPLRYAISKILSFSNKGHFQRKHIISLFFSAGALFNWSPRDLTMAKAYMQYNLSTAYTMRGEYEKAMLNLTKVNNPPNAKAYMQYNLSTAYTMRGEYEKAMLNLTKVNNPPNAKAYMQYNLSTAYTMRGEYEKAMLNLTKVITLK